MSKMFLGGVIINKKAVIFEQLEIVKNYIDSKDVLNIKSAEFVDDTIRLYASSDKSGEAVAEIALPDETFLDGKKTRLVSDFSWSTTEYPKSTNPEFDGETVLVLAVKSRRTVRYSFISLDSVIAKLVGGETESTSVSVADDVVALNVKVSEEANNRVVMKSDGLYVGTVDNTPTWTVSTDDEVSAMFSTSGYGAGTLGAKDVGDIVKIKENGVDTNYIIVHKGLPSDMYDASCDGVWVMRETLLDKRGWDIDGSRLKDYYYKNSSIAAWLDNDFYRTIDSETAGQINQVKIPFKNDFDAINSGIQTGVNGLACKVFLLSEYEVGLTVGTSGRSTEGTLLDYFLDGTGTAAKNKRIAKNSAGTADWWLRSHGRNYTFYVKKDGSGDTEYPYNACSVRPAFILPYDIAVNADGLVL